MIHLLLLINGLKIFQIYIYKLNTLPQSDPACIHIEYIKTLIKSREKIMVSSLYEENIMLNQDISFDKIEVIVKSLKNNKSVGIDCIPYECLKYHHVMLMMYQIFNHCFKNGIVPSTWNKSVITPILKPGKDKYNPLSYRGISLLSCVGKVLLQREESQNMLMNKMVSGEEDPVLNIYLY